MIWEEVCHSRVLQLASTGTSRLHSRWSLPPTGPSWPFHVAAAPKRAEAKAAELLEAKAQIARDLTSTAFREWGDRAILVMGGATGNFCSFIIYHNPAPEVRG